MPASKGTFLTILVNKTYATQVYTAGIDEQDIMARTGHRSEKAVRKYIIQNDIIGSKVSAILDRHNIESAKRVKTMMTIQWISAVKCQIVE